MKTKNYQWRFSEITGYPIFADGVNVFGEVYLMFPACYYQAWAGNKKNTKDFNDDEHDKAKAWVESQFEKLTETAND